MTANVEDDQDDLVSFEEITYPDIKTIIEYITKNVFRQSNGD